MPPPGHIAAGYLVARALFHFNHPAFTSTQITNLIWLGTFFGFAPDLDFFYTLFRIKRWTVREDGENHRNYVSHVPIIWLAAGLAVYFLTSDPFVKYVGLLLWLGSWSHFILDTFSYGIMWAWPFSREVFAFKNKKIRIDIEEQRFLPFWIKFVQVYATKAWLSFSLEVGLIIAASVVFLR